MKKGIFNKGVAYLMAAMAFLTFTAGMCGEDSEEKYKDKWAGLVNEDKKNVSVDGNTLTYGNHKYTVKGEIDYNVVDHKTPTAWVEFTNIPSGYTEFKAVYEGLLGKSIHGTAAMIPMAEEIYARNAATGEKCFNLLCVSEANAKTIFSTLKTKIVASKYSPENDQYIQRYLPAALLQGATYTNAYAPTEPYTVAMCAHVNKPKEMSLIYDGTDYYIYTLTSGGWSTEQRGMEIFQGYDSDLYKVLNCPSAYEQCRTIRGEWAGLK